MKHGLGGRACQTFLTRLFTSVIRKVDGFLRFPAPEADSNPQGVRNFYDILKFPISTFRGFWHSQEVLFTRDMNKEQSKPRPDFRCQNFLTNRKFFNITVGSPVFCQSYEYYLWANNLVIHNVHYIKLYLHTTQETKSQQRTLQRKLSHIFWQRILLFT